MVISWSALAMGILNSMGEFFIPAIAPAALNFLMIISGWTICPLAESYGFPAITGMAIGVMMGGTLQFLVQTPSLFRHGFRFKWYVNLKDPGIRRIVKLIIPGTVGLAATQINIAISTILATSLGDGAVSWLTYSFRIMQLPLGLFGVAIAQATLPVISRQAAANNKDDMGNTLDDSVRLTFFINLFACFSIFALAEPVIRVLFQHGKFSPADTIATANALRAYSVGLVFFCVVKILGPAFYALNETKIPVMASISAVVVNIVLNFAFIKPFGCWGLALGTAFGSMVNAAVLFVFLKKRLINFGRLKQFLSIGKIVIVTSLAGFFQWKLLSPISQMLQNYFQLKPESFFIAFTGLIICLIAGSTILILISKLVRIEEAERAIDMVLKKLKLKKSSR